MDAHLLKFFEKLGRNPAVIFLGQNTLRIDSGEDLFLNAINAKYFDEADNQAK
jgi:hypothetical protein